MSDILSAEQFEREPSVNIGRSTMTGLSHSLKTDFTQGLLSPIFCEPILPGDTFNVKTSFVIRMATPVFPVMDNAVIDIWWFYVPTRLVWDKYREFYGENTTAPWVQTVEYTEPQIYFDTMYNLGTNAKGVIRRGSLMNRLGIATTLFPGISSTRLTSGDYLSVSDLPNRSVRLIWNEFFRDENTQYPLPVYTDSSDRRYTIAKNIDPNDVDYGDALFKVNRLHDYFSSCLPGPQKSLTPVPASLLVDKIPVYSLSEQQDFTQLSDVSTLHFASYVSGNWQHSSMGNNFDLYSSTGNDLRGQNGTVIGSTYAFTPDNLYARASDITFATVNSLRQSFAIQRYYEQLARTGSRIREILQGFFQVEVPDTTIAVPEYLGGCRTPINIDQVLQTSSTDSTSPQGNTAGYSLTTSTDDSFVKSFVEPGYLIGLASVRVQHTYTGMIRPFWFRKRRFDHYWPQFASISEQPVFKKYLNATGVSAVDDQVFGYQEAFADYRYCPNMVSGVFSPISTVDSSSGSLVYTESQSPEAGAWTFADHYVMDYQNAVDQSLTSRIDPSLVDSVTLSSEWMEEPYENVQQTIAVQDEPQFIGDFYFDVKATRPMPVRSIPGLIDHH